MSVVTASTSAWEGLAHRAPTAKTPPVIPGRRFEAVPDVHEPEPMDLAELDGLDLEGLTLGIVYRDSKGDETQRRVTMHRMTVSAGAAVYIACFCHERQANRSFRYDRIHSVIDVMTGELFDRDPFFVGELGICVPACACADTVPSLFKQVRSRARHELVILAGLSRSDGCMRPEEIDVIVDHAQQIGADVDLWLEADDVAQMRRYVRNLRPDVASLVRAAHAVADLPTHRQMRLLRACQTVMDADGIQHPDEIAFIIEMQDLIAG